jgi:prevent-host-death family protein
MIINLIKDTEMIQVNVSEIKNRLSYYLRLVRGGEQIEIVDRKTPLARIIHVSQVDENTAASWIKELEKFGIVTPPKIKGFPQEFLNKEKITLAPGNAKPGVLKALLEERNSGR